jgi:U4/U6.U5 tri-snRNP-associated protein 1
LREKVRVLRPLPLSVSSTSSSPVAQEQLHELAAPNGNDDTLPEQEDNADGLVFDDTSEFVRAISYNPVSVKAEESVERRTPAQPIVIQVNTGRATDGAEMQDADEELEELEDGEMASIKEEEDDTAMLLAIENAIMNADGGRGRSVSEAPAEVSWCQFLHFSSLICSSSLRSVHRESRHTVLVWPRH